MSQHNRTQTVLAVLIALAVVMPSVYVFAVGESVSIDSLDVLSGCAPGQTVSGEVTHDNGTEAVSIRFTLENLTRSTNTTFTSPILPTGSYPFGVSIPANTEYGDAMRMTIDLLDVGGLVLVSDSLDFVACGAREVPMNSTAGLIVLVISLAIAAGFILRRHTV